MRVRLVCILSLVLLTALAAARGAAQSLAAAPTALPAFTPTVDSSSAWGGTVSPPTSCTASLPPSDMERQAVYLDARMAPGTSDLLTNQADLLASDVQTTMNAMLTSPNSSLAGIAANVKFYSVPAELIVVARRNGEMSWRGVSLSGDSSAFAILAIALDSARHHGAAVMLWPDGLSADSLVIRLTLLPQNFAEAPLAGIPDRIRSRFPAFAAPVPKVTPPRLLSDPPHFIPFPNRPVSDRISGLAYIAFVIDTTGHVVPDSFHDLWPADHPRLTGTHAAYYEQLLGRVKAYEVNASYSPGRAGSCRTSVVVHQSVTFDGTLSTDRYSKWE